MDPESNADAGVVQYLFLDFIQTSLKDKIPVHRKQTNKKKNLGDQYISVQSQVTCEPGCVQMHKLLASVVPWILLVYRYPAKTVAS